jgi:hypothetical protein
MNTGFAVKLANAGAPITADRVHGLGFGPVGPPRNDMKWEFR